MQSISISADSLSNTVAGCSVPLSKLRAHHNSPADRGGQRLHIKATGDSDCTVMAAPMPATAFIKRSADGVIDLRSLVLLQRRDIEAVIAQRYYSPSEWEKRRTKHQTMAFPLMTFRWAWWKWSVRGQMWWGSEVLRLFTQLCGYLNLREIINTNVNIYDWGME